MEHAIWEPSIMHEWSNSAVRGNGSPKYSCSEPSNVSSSEKHLIAKSSRDHNGTHAYTFNACQSLAVLQSIAPPQRERWKASVYTDMSWKGPFPHPGPVPTELYERDFGVAQWLPPNYKAKYSREPVFLDPLFALERIGGSDTSKNICQPQGIQAVCDHPQQGEMLDNLITQCSKDGTVD